MMVDLSQTKSKWFGEIEVRVRQVLLKKVLDKEADLYNLLVDSCSKDHGFTGRKKIGF